MARESMSQDVRAHLARIDAGGGSKLFQFARDMLPRDVAAIAERGKQPPRLADLRFDEQLTVVAHCLLRRLPERHQPLPSALAAHRYRPPLGARRRRARE